MFVALHQQWRYTNKRSSLKCDTIKDGNHMSYCGAL